MPVTSSATVPPSIWSEISAGEIVLLIAGAVLTLAIISFFTWVIIRASRDSAASQAADRAATRDETPDRPCG